MCARFRLRFGLGLLMVGAWTGIRAESATATATAAAAAEAGAPLLQWWDPEAYRAHQQIWQGAQSPDGVMWFGNSHSVLRFDGQRWQRIGVPTSYVRAVAAGPDGRIWVGGTDELGLIEPDANGLPAYRSLQEALPAADRAVGVIWSIVVRSDGVFFASESRVLRWDGRAFRIWHMENFSRQLLLPVGEALLLHRQGVGLFRFDGDDFVPVADEPRWRESRNCRVVPGDDGAWILLLSDGLLWRWQGGRLERFAEAADAVLAESPARYLARLADGGYALGGRQGVVHLDAAGRFVGRVDQAHGMGNETVFSLTPDREGGLWIGTDHGLGRWSLSNGITRFGEAEGLPRALATAMVRHRGVMHLVYDDGVYRLVPADAARGTLARFERAFQLPSYTWALVSHAAGLLIGAGDGVWWRAEAADGEASEPVRVMATPAGVGFLQPMVGQPDRVWSGNFLGLARLRWDGAGWQVEAGLPDLATEVRSLAEAANGDVWVGTPTRGFGRLRPATAGGWTVTWWGESAGLRADHGWCHVYRDGRGEPLFVTDTGTYRFDEDAERFGLAAEMQIAGRSDLTQLWPLTVAEDGTCWAQADTEQSDWPRLIGRLDPRLPESDPAHWQPLPRLAVEAGGYGGMRAMHWEPERRRLWLAGSGVVVAVDVDQIKTAAPVSPVWTRARLPDGREVGPVLAGGDGGWRYDYGRAPLLIEWATPAFGEGPGRLYRTRLRGYDEAWSEWQAEPRASFTNLSGGDYRFEVQARDPEARAAGEVAMAVTVVPPWWESGAARLGWLVLGLGLAWAGLRWRVAAVERRAARLAGLVDARTRDLVQARDEAEAANRAKSEFVAGISHELRHPLQSILGHAELLQRDPRATEQQRERGAVIDASGRRLLRLIDDVLDVARLDAARLNLRPTPCDLGRLVDRVEAAHAPLAAARGLRWRVVRPMAEPLPVANVDAERLGQILDNLVGNALKFTRRGEVELRVEWTAEGLAWAVRDTGPGIAADEVGRIFNAFEQGAAGRGQAGGVGLGLAISRSLATMMGGRLGVESELGRGSCFTLVLPLPVPETETAGEAVTPWQLAEAGMERALAALREAAGCGDIEGVRVALAGLREAPALAGLVEELEAMVNQFQLAGIRRRLRDS